METKELMLQRIELQHSPINAAKRMRLTELVLAKLLKERLLLPEHAAIISWLARNEKFSASDISATTGISFARLFVLLDELYIWSIVQFNESGYFISDHFESLHNLMVLSERANAVKGENFNCLLG